MEANVFLIRVWGVSNLLNMHSEVSVGAILIDHGGGVLILLERNQGRLIWSSVRI